MLSNLLPGRRRFPDRAIQDRAFYIWQAELDVSLFKEGRLQVEQRRRHPEDTKYPNPYGITLCQNPIEALSFWPGRLFRVGEVKGLRRMSFTPNHDSIGWCEAYTILEELPSTLVLGPNGAAVAALVERVTSLNADEIQQLGEAARSAKGRAWGAAERRLFHNAYEASGLSRVDNALRTYIEGRLIDLALETDGEIGRGHLLDEFQGCDRYLDFIDPVWSAARRAVHDAISAAILAGAVEPSVEAWLNEPWQAFAA